MDVSALLIGTVAENAEIARSEQCQNDKMSFMLIRVLSLVFILSSCSFVNPKSPSRKMYFKLPKDYKQINSSSKKDGSFVKEFIPKSEDPQNWSNMIRYVYQPTKTEVYEQFKEMADVIGKVCEEPFVPKPFTGKFGGAEALNGLTACGKHPNTKLGEISQYLMVQDIDGIHSVQKTVRTEPFKEKEANAVIKENLKTWNDFFQTLKFK